MRDHLVLYIIKDGARKFPESFGTLPTGWIVFLVGYEHQEIYDTLRPPSHHGLHCFRQVSFRSDKLALYRAQGGLNTMETPAEGLFSSLFEYHACLGVYRHRVEVIIETIIFHNRHQILIYTYKTPLIKCFRTLGRFKKR